MARGHDRTRGRPRPGSEAGFAVPAVMVTMIVAFTFASVTVVASVGAQKGTTRDQSSKAALAAAEAGVSEALLHYNRIPTVSATPCLVGTPVVIAPPDASGWCAPVSRAVTGPVPGSFSYRVRPASNTLTIASTGTVAGISRRVHVVAASSGGLRPFGDANVIGLDFLTMASNATITANVATNGNITMASNSVIDCDYAKVGVGRTVIGSENYQFNCPAPVQDTTSLPPVNQGDVATNNSNGNFFSLDTYTGGQPDWDAATRQLSLNSNRTLTLTGSNYSFCSLTMSSNSRLIIAAGATVRIYFDSPEACGLASGTTQLSMSSNTRITPTGSDPGHVALLFMGSDTRITRISLASNTQVPAQTCEQDFVVYAPRTEITMASNSTFCGGIAGKSILMSANASISTNNLTSDFELPGTVAPHYAAERLVECGTPVPVGSAPDWGC
jgi:type II secretory pathway pseudopilin PulG